MDPEPPPDRATTWRWRWRWRIGAVQLFTASVAMFSTAAADTERRGLKQAAGVMNAIAGLLCVLRSRASR